nr:MAG TPA: hypothetical protein [Bacteriophage sp.]
MVISKCHFNKKDVYKYYHLFLINNKLKYYNRLFMLYYN